MAVQYKSILKPTIPLSPTKPIPPHGTVRTRSPAKAKDKSSPATPRTKNPVNPSQPEDLVATPQGERSVRISNDAAVPPLHTSPGRCQTRVAVRTEEQQQQAATEERERQILISRKDARRKSLGQDPSNCSELFHATSSLGAWEEGHC